MKKRKPDLMVVLVVFVLGGCVVTTTVQGQDIFNGTAIGIGATVSCTDSMAFRQQCTRAQLLWDAAGGRPESRPQDLATSIAAYEKRANFDLGHGLHVHEHTYLKAYEDQGRAIAITGRFDSYGVAVTVTDPGISIRKEGRRFEFDARFATARDDNGERQPFAFVGVAASW